MTYSLAIGSLAALGLEVFAGRASIVNQMNGWLLLPRPQHLTELYFSDYKHLPTLLKPGASPKLAFTVHNLEHQTTTYTYTVTARSADKTAEKVLGKGTITLAHNHSFTANPAIVMPALEGQIALKVELGHEGLAFGDDTPTPQTQSIDYWVKVAAPPVAKTKAKS